MKSVVLRLVGPSVAALLFSACASVSVKDVASSHGPNPKAAPHKYYVVPFSTAGADIKEHPRRKNPGQLGNEAQQLIAQALVADLSANLGPAKLVKSPAAAGHDGWLITGRITKLNEGSRILRMAIGLGAGGTKMETQVEVTNASAGTQPFMHFKTTGGSGAEPGAATNPIPFSSAPTALFAATKGVTDDAGRTARMITAQIADYQVKHGWLAPGKIVKPKIAGQL